MTTKKQTSAPRWRVKSVSKTGFRRAGLFFPPQGKEIDPSELSEADVKAIQTERNLIITEV